jgi:hypothetical protein
MNPKKLEIVIASYMENLWYVPRLEALGCKVTIYNANGGNANCFKVDPVTAAPYDFTPVKSISVPNEAREASQWFRFILSNYGKFSPYTLFMQADMGWSCVSHSHLNFGAGHAKLYQLLAWIDLASECDFMAYDSHISAPIWLDPDQIEEAKKYFDPLTPPSLTTHQPGGGQFMCSAKFLNRIPKEYFDKLLDMCKKNPGFAHDVEFIWPLILDCYGTVWPIPK